MHPLDDVVPGVHRVHVGGHVADLERVDEARRLEDVTPPLAADLEGRAVRLGHGRVEVVDDRLDGLAHRGVRIALLQPVPHRVAGHVLLVEGLPEVEVAHREEADARVEAPRPEVGVGEPHERVVLAQRERAPVRGVARDLPTGIGSREGQRRLHLGVLGERPGARQVDAAPLRVDPERALPGPAKAVGDPHHVLVEERRRVDEHGVPVLGDDLPRGERRRGERLLDGARQRVGPVDVGAEARVPEHEVHLRTHALEARDVLRADHAPVQAQPVRPDPGRQRLQVEEVLPEPVDLEQQAPLLRVPVEPDEAGVGLHAGSALRDALGARRR